MSLSFLKPKKQSQIKPSWGLHELMHGNCLEEWLASNRHDINVNRNHTAPVHVHRLPHMHTCAPICMHLHGYLAQVPHTWRCTFMCTNRLGPKECAVPAHSTRALVSPPTHPQIGAHTYMSAPTHTPLLFSAWPTPSSPPSWPNHSVFQIWALPGAPGRGRWLLLAELVKDRVPSRSPNTITLWIFLGCSLWTQRLMEHLCWKGPYLIESQVVRWGD